MASPVSPLGVVLAKATRARTALLLAVAVFLGVLGQKLALIERYGSDLPYWDAWDGEADLLFRPAAEGHFPWSIWLSAHNEHRILFTRILAYGLFRANSGQWDARLEGVANAVLASTVASLLFLLAAGPLPKRLRAPLALLVTVLLGSRLSFENTLAGFQSQFYFLLLIPGAHLWASTTSRPWSARWWLSFGLGLASLVTMASGLLSAAAVAALLGLEAARDRVLTRDRIVMLGANSLLLGLGWLLKVDRPYHDFLKAATPAAWLDAFLHQLAWPSAWSVASCLAALPLGLALLALARGREVPYPRTLTAFALWGWLQCAAIAYARGGVDHGHASRYTDLLSSFVVINTVLLAVLAGAGKTPRSRRVLAGLAVLSVSVSLWGVARETRKVTHDDLEPMRGMNEARLSSVREFVKEPGPAFYRREPWTELPYPSAERLGSLLSNPTIRSFLPASVLTPPALRADPGASTGFDSSHPPPQAGSTPEDLPVLACGPGEWDLLSEPFAVARPVASLYVAGSGSDPETSVSLVDREGHRHPSLGPIAPLSPTWRRVNVVVPPGVYRLAAHYRGQGWMGVTAVKSRTRLSHLAETLSHGGALALGLAGALFLAGLVLCLGVAPQAALPFRGSPTT